MLAWTPKTPDSIEFFPVDMVRQLAAKDHIASCTCAIKAINGVDPDAEAMLEGGVEISGTTVAQKVGGGLWGCKYQLTFTAHTGFGETLIVKGAFMVGRTEPDSRDLTTVDAVKAWCALKHSDHDAMLQKLITAESRAIERHIGRPVLAETRTDTLTGYGSREMLLPLTPIISIERAIIGAAAVKASHDALRAWRSDGGVWPRGSRVQVTYTAGFDAVPYDIEQACIELVALRYKERDRIGHASKSMDGGTVSYITEAIPKSVESRLAPYRRVAPLC